MKRWATFGALILLLGCAAAVSSSAHKQTAETPARADYVGEAVCAECHAGIAASYAVTNHARTSSLPTSDTVLGSFASGSNAMETIDPNLTFRMERRGADFFERAAFSGSTHTKDHSEPIGLVVGSGEKGQTYLYWRGDALFQLPVSWWRGIGWINSPGYLDGTADFDRPIPPRCMECHATYFHSLPGNGPPNHFVKTDYALGLSCERCHGPGRRHVELMRASTTQLNATAATSAPVASAPSEISHAIVNPAKLARDRRTEVCAQCHGGLGTDLGAAFTFVPGEKLEEHIQLPVQDANSRVDVHGNQVALMERSRCYINSPEFTCTTCHTPHESERAAATYSTTCLACHKAQQCGEFATLGEKIADNCIDCHMPVQASSLIVSEIGGKSVRAQVRNHWIKIYPTASANN